MSASNSDVQTSRETQEDVPLMEINSLKELGKKALIDALNSVRRPISEA